ncbi:TPA: bifunctional glucose-1-phosphatase/inositol phosphatase [Klebsiella variicola subsp. variicola]|uniref:bifunctional glucose-1-phosphatase/inositol phosphatase n=1 Tax=Klebsiella variicola TaxID=244366 RepID=UPI000B3E7480|nr:bifunctional glucose-1-phosphatase/inositol phosphatase [Klebsiella variicola]AXO70637.1 bifunctional glucose-1-phosphatase/inositol phosphatase [Klebsiella variicola]EIY5151833.1 bifunctional glucose-1-phosphatase/inositol phosphatase [Klebsiella variicola]MCJ1833490.1 bifunctional glucose-1-phosphatase/inositol phosphatase [Klebsiella variicola subsp. variicola]MCS5962863.1 bifunctional glucose-1-phosphatase/inositol phosphatase [Klebsiella variicola subsp. variicola]OUY90577.1 bifunction
MKKRLLAAAVAGAVMLSAGAQAQDSAAPEGYQLQQVLIMSRHNLRAPLANNGSVLEQSTAKAWPQWDVPGGQLTTKGGVLEVYMGHYMREWLAQQKLVTSGECPPENAVYAYANSLQRTVATAQFFITGAFPGCGIAVHHQPQMGTMDPTFNPVITDDSPAFREKALQAMEKERQGMQLTESYKLLETMIDYRNSPSCKEKQVCSLSEGKDTFSAGYQHEPGVSGPLKVGNSLVDAFTLQYYEGFPKDQVAWGEITSDKQWQVLSKLKNGYQDSLFTSVAVAQNVAKPLVKYIDNVLVGEEANKAKVTLLVGHDSNIASLLTALDFKPYQLPGQYERTPIGGKLLFQRWHDSAGNRDLMKIEYVYQSTEQLRNADALTLQAPPQRVTLALNGCPVDDQGFCPLETFKKVINEAAK